MIIDWIFNLVNLSDFAPGDPWVARRWTNSQTSTSFYWVYCYKIQPLPPPGFRTEKNEYIWSYHIISYTTSPLFPQENLGRPIQHHQRHLPAPAPIVGLPHPLQPPARGACGGRSGGHRARFWARRSKHRKRHLDGSPPLRPMETWRFRNSAPNFRCVFFEVPCFFLIWLQLSPVFCFG